jgi:hypothetical protein
MKDSSAQARRQRQEELAAEAKHARDRARLYRAKLHGPRP